MRVTTVLVLIGCCLTSLPMSQCFAQHRLPMERGAQNLLTDHGLTKPFSVFDQLLLGLSKQADIVAESFAPWKGDYRPSRVSPTTFALVDYDRQDRRVGIRFSLVVDGMDDPWREVCKRQLMAAISIEGLGLPVPEAREFMMGSFLYKLLGPTSRIADDPPKQFEPFVESLAVIVQFEVVSGVRSKPFKEVRSCIYDNASGKVAFDEYKY